MSWTGAVSTASCVTVHTNASRWMEVAAFDTLERHLDKSCMLRTIVGRAPQELSMRFSQLVGITWFDLLAS